MALRPSPEFHAEAVRVTLTSGLYRKQVAADFGVGFSTLSRWIQQERKNPEKPTAQSDLEREVAELRRENRLSIGTEALPTGASRISDVLFQVLKYDVFGVRRQRFPESGRRFRNVRSSALSV